MPTPAWWLYLMTTIVVWSLLTWWWPLQWSQHDAARSMLVDDVHGALESWWWSLDGLIDCDDGDGACLMWWSPDDGDGACLMMMQLGEALMLPYVFIVFIDVCGWIPCHMMPWSHGSHSWWRWLLDEFWPCWGWHDSLMEMPWWCLAMIVDADDISCLDMLMYLVDEDMIHSCWWDVDELMSLVMRYPIPFHSPSLALALPILAIPCKTLIHPS